MKTNKLLAMLLVCLMVIGMVSVNAAEINNVPIQLRLSADSLIPLTNRLAAAQTPSFYNDIEAVGSISQRITLNEEGTIAGIGMDMPSYSNNIGTATVTVYEWQGEYVSTLKSKPIISKDFIDQADNAFCSMGIPNNSGDILVHLTNGSDKVGVWVTNTPATDTQSTQTTYVGGKEITGCLSLSYQIGNKIDTGVGTVAKINPYEYIIPSANDGTAGKTENIEITDPFDGSVYDMVQFGKLHIGSYHSENAYLVYNGVDFGETSPKRVSARIYLTPFVSAYVHDVQFALDSPEGEVIASIRPIYDTARAMEAAKEGSTGGYWEEIVSEVTKPVTGVHNLYVLIRGMYSYQVNTDPQGLGKFKFIKEEIDVTGWEKDLKDYVPVPDSNIRPSYSDTWVATDDIGRKLPGYAEVGDRKDRGVFMFYFSSTPSPANYTDWNFSNNQSVQDGYPGDFEEVKRSTSYVGLKQSGYWNESIYGYYAGVDRWVIRKNMELLGLAGVDAICTDESNSSWQFPSAHMAYLREMHAMRQDGYETPKLVQIQSWGNGQNTMLGIEHAYNLYFGSGLYDDCWYYLDGKPLIMAAGDGEIANETGNALVDAKHQEIRDFFTFRPCEPGYKVGEPGPDWWPWCSNAPQPGFNFQEDTGKYEIMAVSVAQNSNDKVSSYTGMNGYDVYGRSYTHKDRFSKYSDTSIYYGYNYQEQWDYALKADPENVFLTGWNEWKANKVTNTLFEGINYCDQFDDEYSRDAEPTIGKLKDTYYMQTVENIRRYKGVNKTPVATGTKAISVSGDFSQWNGVGPEFVDSKNDVQHRDYAGRVGGYWYTNTTGRNDIITSKASHDAENIYFYTETINDLTPATDKNWMRLYINADRKYATGWEGYEYIINRVSPVDGKVIIEKYTGADNNWKWAEVARADYKVQGNKLMISVPRSILGVNGAVDIEFKWHDNGVDDGNVLDFYLNGDAAPAARFNYHYVESEELANAPAVDEPKDLENDLEKLTNKYILMGIGKNFAYAKGNRKFYNQDDLSIAPMIVGGETFVPVQFIAKTWDAQYTETNNGQSAMVIYGEYSASITVGKEQIKGSNKMVNTKNAPFIYNGTLFAPIRALCEALNFDCVWVDPGLIIMGQNVKMKVALYPEFVQRMLARMDLA